MKKKVYIAGPYTKGDVAQNVARAIRAASHILEHGAIPYVPHLTHFWHLLQWHHWETWIEYDAEWLRVCDVFFRLEGESKGADCEEALARELKIPICLTWDDLMELL